MKRIMSGLLVYLGCYSSALYAEQFAISAAQINQQVQQRFPLVRQYEEVEATFYNPKVILKYLDNEIDIKLKVKVSYQGQTLEADGLIKGTTSFQQATNSLRFDRPILDEFYVVQDNMSDSTEAIKVVKQSIGPSLPPIILLNFEHLDVNTLSNEPTSVTLSPQGLELEY
ncbi:MAG: hypothetical protein NWQ26_05360 [Paraglaciecola sp.]|nr:hypothetical protein [Paraglaciecola sp.]